jgi:hypothetical protein
MTLDALALALAGLLCPAAHPLLQEVPGFGEPERPLRHLDLAAQADDVDQEVALERWLYEAERELALPASPTDPFASEQHLGEQPTLLLTWGGELGAREEGTLKACLEWAKRKEEFRTVVEVHGDDPWFEIARLRFALGKTARDLPFLMGSLDGARTPGDAYFHAGVELSQERFDALFDLRAELGFSLCQQQLEELAGASAGDRERLARAEAESFAERAQPAPAPDLRGSWVAGIREFKELVEQAEEAVLGKHGFLLDAQVALCRGDREALDKAMKQAVKDLEKEGQTIDKALAKLEEDPDSDSLTVRGFYVRRDAWQRQNDVLPLLDEWLAAQQQLLAARAWRLAHAGAADLAARLGADLRRQANLDPLALRSLQLLEREFTAVEPRAEIEAAEAFADLVDDISGNPKRLAQAEAELTEFLARFAGTRASKRAEAWLALN